MATKNKEPKGRVCFSHTYTYMPHPFATDTHFYISHSDHICISFNNHNGKIIPSQHNLSSPNRTCAPYNTNHTNIRYR